MFAFLVETTSTLMKIFSIMFFPNLYYTFITCDKRKSNERRAKSNEQRTKRNDQEEKSNEQRVKSNEQQAKSNEQRAKCSALCTAKLWFKEKKNKQILKIPFQPSLILFPLCRVI